MSEPTRPRPRPKPRRIEKPVTQASTSSTIPSSPSIQCRIDEEDEDKLFMRNTKRTSTTWKKLEEINKVTKLPRQHSESEDEAGVTATPGQRNKKKQRASPSIVPRWAKDKEIIRLLSEEISDNETLQAIDNTPGTKGPGMKRKRNARSRSRSITPPPQLPIHQIQNARNLVRQTLHTHAPRAASPTHFLDFEGDDSTDTIVLDPELQRVAQAVTSQSLLNFPSTSSPNRSFSPSQSSLSHLQYQHTQSDFFGDGAPEEVMLTVNWLPHPLNEAGRKQEWAFKMLRHGNFRDLFEEVADLAHILSFNLIISHDGKRIFPSVTPNTLRIWDRAELEACDKTTYEYLRTHKQSRQASQSLNHESDPSNDDSDHDGNDAQVADSDAEGDGSGKFKLILRSAKTNKDITLTVRPTTTCGAIVQAFIRSAGLNVSAHGKTGKGKEEPSLFLDGEKLANDNEIGEMDLEDGDLVEVVGL